MRRIIKYVLSGVEHGLISNTTIIRLYVMFDVPNVSAVVRTIVLKNAFVDCINFLTDGTEKNLIGIEIAETEQRRFTMKFADTEVSFVYDDIHAADEALMTFSS